MRKKNQTDGGHWSKMAVSQCSAREEPGRNDRSDSVLNSPAIRDTTDIRGVCGFGPGPLISIRQRQSSRKKRILLFDAGLFTRPTPRHPLDAPFDQWICKSMTVGRISRFTPTDMATTLPFRLICMVRVGPKSLFIRLFDRRSIPVMAG